MARFPLLAPTEETNFKLERVCVQKKESVIYLPAMRRVAEQCEI